MPSSCARRAPIGPSKPGVSASQRAKDPVKGTWSPQVRFIMNRTTIAGCLAMVYIGLVGGTQRTEFIRQLGANKLHFGIIGAIAPAMLAFQFLSGLAVSQLRRRKGIWIGVMLLHRAMMIPLALLPFIFPDLSNAHLIWGVIMILACSDALGNFGVPMWFSWMSEILPKENFNEIWAVRRRWLALTTGLVFLATAAFFYQFRDIDIRITFCAVALLGAAAGIWDILLFIKIPEKETVPNNEAGLKQLQAPFLDKNFRGMIIFSAYLTFCLAFVAPFFQLYMLEVLALPLYGVMLLFFIHSLGGAIFSQRFGILADKMGQRPVIILCTALKSLLVIGMFCAQPGPWVLLLVPVLLFDNMMNTGLLVSRNGYMLKQSPLNSRSMYVAAVLAMSGIAGAAGSLLGGYILHTTDGFLQSWWIFTFTPFHIIFGIGILLRWSCILAALLIKEPYSRAPSKVLIEVLGPAASRWLKFPVRMFLPRPRR